ncbi:MAG: hypothetical protein B6U78_02065 [Candidatus Aenigmarchaeota archaeon ex4484_224]|nr:MAG: hypothetical protein B6U78_02065 [Candidatus Aenigmarchaeota archaeon ex4484_224]
MKGISPLIAAVLLIAFTVAVGGIIATWLTSFSKTTTGAAGGQTKTLLGCSGAYIEILSYDHTNGKIVFKNPSTAKIYVVQAINETGGTTDINVALDGGKVGSGTAPKANTKIILSGFCEYNGQNTTIDGSCSKTDNCWQ